MKKRIIIFTIIMVFFIFFLLLLLTINNKKNNKDLKYLEYSDDVIWCGTFQIAWNELRNYLGVENISFVQGNPEIVDKLNNGNFSTEMISEESYIAKIYKPSTDISKEIKDDVYRKFKIKSDYLITDNLNLEDSNGIVLYSMLKKDFRFLKKFDDLKYNYFYDLNENDNLVRYFGIDINSSIDLIDNFKIIFYEDYNNFAIKIYTKENDELILYKVDNVKEKSFEELYNNINNYEKNYESEKNFLSGDILRIPYINLNYLVSYSELCNKKIINSNEEYISNAIQTIQFYLNENGGGISSEAVIKTDYLSGPLSTTNYYEFNSPFVIFLKETSKDEYYFAVKILNQSFLVKN